jgi:hypothetical protein
MGGGVAAFSSQHQAGHLSVLGSAAVSVKWED